MPVSGVNTNPIQNTSAADSDQITRSVGSTLGKDDFLKILVAQLQNQDPTSPMEDKEFIAQLAQFSSLEQMQALNSSFTFGQAYNLIGKNIFAEYAGEDGRPAEIFGKVTGVVSSKGTAYLEVDKTHYVPFNNEIVVYESEAAAATAGGQTPTGQINEEEV